MSIIDVAELAGEQWGLVTTAQAAKAGVSAQRMARWANEGALVRLVHGVYRVAGSAPHPSDDIRAAWLALEPRRTAVERIASEPIDAVVSHRSAARLHRLGDLDADVYQFTVQGRKQSRHPDVRIRRRSAGLDRDAWTLVDGLPVTTVVTTTVDLAADHTDGGHLAGVVRDALVSAVVDLDELSTALRPYSHRYGAPLGDGDALVQRLLAEAGLPRTTARAVALVRETTTAAAARRVVR